MSVLIQTTKGDIVVDLYTDECPMSCQNFLSLCRIKYYHGCLFFNIEHNMLIQTGDPTNTGRGGQSIFGLLQQQQRKRHDAKQQVSKNRGFFANEIHGHLKHKRSGLLCMANSAPNRNTSQFYITTTDRHLESLDDRHTIFGAVAEGMDVVMAINDVLTDDDGRPYQAIRIKRTVVLVDPFEEEGTQLSGLEALVPEGSPEWQVASSAAAAAIDSANGDVGDGDGQILLLDEEEERQLEEQKLKTKEELEEALQVDEAHSRAVVLAAIGDLPDEDIRPPDNVLFVCKLNPVTRDEDLKVLFSQFGKVVSCEIIKDKFTGESLCFGFVEFETRENCEDAYFKMDNVMVDDRRIHVDFSQSVAKLWNKNRRMGGNASYSKEEQNAWRNHSRDRTKNQDPRPTQLPKQYGGTSFDIVLDHDEHDQRRGRRSRVRDEDEGRRGYKDKERKHTKRRKSSYEYSSDSSSDEDSKSRRKRRYHDEELRDGRRSSSRDRRSRDYDESRHHRRSSSSRRDRKRRLEEDEYYSDSDKDRDYRRHRHRESVRSRDRR